MDYLMFFFDNEQIANEFINVMQDVYFNKCQLAGEILKPRRY